MKLSGSIFDIEKTKIDFVKRVPFPPFSLLFYLVHYRSSPIIWYTCRQKTLGFNAKAPAVAIVVPEGVRHGTRALCYGSG